MIPQTDISLSFPFPIELILKTSTLLLGTTVDDGGLESCADLTTARAKGLEFLDDLHAVLISNFAEDDVLAIEPRGDNGGDEELRSVAARTVLAES